MRERNSGQLSAGDVKLLGRPLLVAKTLYGLQSINYPIRADFAGYGSMWRWQERNVFMAEGCEALDAVWYGVEFELPRRNTLINRHDGLVRALSGVRDQFQTTAGEEVLPVVFTGCRGVFMQGIENMCC